MANGEWEVEIRPSSCYDTESEPALVTDATERGANGASHLESLPDSNLGNSEEEEVTEDERRRSQD